jgi:hypothetical protein
MGNDAIIIHGFIKKKNKTDISQLERAVNLRDRYIKAIS